MAYGERVEKAVQELRKAVAPEIRKGVLPGAVHFNRDGGRLCECCQLEGIRNYPRTRQYLLDGRTFLLLCDTAHTRTQVLPGGHGSYGVERDVFSEENLKSARIFEIDRAKLDRSDLTRGQRLLGGAEREAIVGRLLGNEGELRTICAAEEIVGRQVVRKTYYLADEPHPAHEAGKLHLTGV